MKNIMLFFSLMTLIFSDQAIQASPNFILILTDDHGWTSLSTQMDIRLSGSRSDYYETPHIDRLADLGMRFSRGYAPAAICTPTRRSILYGQSAIRQGDEAGFAARYHPDKHDFLTIPLMLKQVNEQYKTAHFGKWHIQGEFFPEDVSYDESDGNTNNSGGNMFEDKADKWKKTFFSGDPKKADQITSRGINFIKRCVSSGHPFYLQLSHYATHVDIQAKTEDYDRFSDKPRGKVHDHPGYAAMLYHLDQGIGKLLDYVDQIGIADHTYIILMSDNGGVEFIPPSGNKLLHPDQNPQKQRNFPLRGGKWVLFEGGIRVPFIIKGPGIKSGSQCNQPVIGYDLLPTLADLAGYQEKLPEYIDGVSFKNLLFQPEQPLDRKDEALYFHRYSGSYPHSAIIMGQYKLVKFWKSSGMKRAGVELYDLKADREEVHDIGNDLTEEKAFLEEKLMDYIKKVNPELLSQLQDYKNYN